MPINRLIEKEEVNAYATVLFDGLKGDQARAVEVFDQMKQIVSVARSSMDLTSSLDDNGYAPEQRNQMAKAIFADCDETLVEVLAVMAERGSFNMLPRVLENYEQQLVEKLNTSVVDVTTVVPLDDNLRQIITQKVESDLGTKVVLKENIDTSILGGIIMTSGGKKIDASVVSQLENASKVLKQTQISDGGEC